MTRRKREDATLKWRGNGNWEVPRALDTGGGMRWEHADTQGVKMGTTTTLFRVDITPLNVKRSLTCERMRKVTGEATKEYKTCEQ